jgi:hypothetical protein
MKRYVTLILLIIFIAGCAKEVPDGNSAHPDANSQPPDDAPVIDIDLMGFSTSMIYATMTDIFNKHEEYSGTVLRVNGHYDPFFFMGTERLHHIMIIEGPPGCCPKQVEIIWDGDYPEAMTSIRVTGAFSVHEEKGFMFPSLTVSEIIIID